MSVILQLHDWGPLFHAESAGLCLHINLASATLHFKCSVSQRKCVVNLLAAWGNYPQVNILCLNILNQVCSAMREKGDRNVFITLHVLPHYQTVNLTNAAGFIEIWKWMKINIWFLKLRAIAISTNVFSLHQTMSRQKNISLQRIFRKGALKPSDQIFINQHREILQFIISFIHINKDKPDFFYVVLCCNKSLIVQSLEVHA